MEFTAGEHLTCFNILCKFALSQVLACDQYEVNRLQQFMLSPLLSFFSLPLSRLPDGIGNLIMYLLFENIYWSLNISCTSIRASPEVRNSFQWNHILVEDNDVTFYWGLKALILFSSFLDFIDIKSTKLIYFCNMYLWYSVAVPNIHLCGSVSLPKSLSSWSTWTALVQKLLFLCH